ncbi:tRNA1(Val) (adenine(37)-N6)-methyltransferase [Alkalihalobacillus oceani]|uniref:tRNA1(Val) (adenine(37)-N6)-methyltransferase n=1 Tax=Halalkalibacter oceani TaxID=1653776 RepID=UPI00203D8DA3|nr:tRNA1(Val) (adenine(37)-N6)-methyltransferase [Halalkalibacter oceani]
MDLLQGERWDYIAGTELRVIQSPDVFSFSIDAILLGRFVHLPIQKGRILDLCTGNGVIPLVMATRSKAEIIGVELQARLADMARRTVEANRFSSRVTIIEADIKQLPQDIRRDSFDVVTCNPPYFQTATIAERNLNPHLAIARHEIHCTLDDVIRACSECVKQKGKVALVHRPERLGDLITLMRAYRIEPKRMQLIHPKAGKEANMVLLEGIKDGKAGMICLPPLTVYNEKGEYSAAFRAVYENNADQQQTVRKDNCNAAAK